MPGNRSMRETSASPEDEGACPLHSVIPWPSSGAPPPADLPGIAAAALVTLSLGAVLGPEAPLIALGAGLGGLAMRLARRDAPAQATAVVAADFVVAADCVNAGLVRDFATGRRGRGPEQVCADGTRP